MKRVHVSALILVTWFVMIGWQFRREYFQPELTRLAEAALSLAPGISFYTLRMGERTVGQATSRLDTVPEGFVLEDVPAGSYKLRVWHETLGEKTVDVVVEAGKTASVDVAF